MSGPQPGEVEQAERYLKTLTERAPRYGLLDVRYRTQGRRFSQVFLHADDRGAPRRMARLGQRADVYVGCAPRIRPRGTREDVAPTALLWADCDDAQSVAKARAFIPKPTMIVASGSFDHAHMYWALSEVLDPTELSETNRRLAVKLGADVKCADATRILRVPGTWNHKRHPSPVELVHHSEKRHDPTEMLMALHGVEHSQRESRQNRAREQDDPLQQIEPAHYVRLLTGRTIDREGKIACPFHQDDKPSLHVYPTPEQGWACFGCKTPDGKPRGGDIYTLASHLWGIPTKGSGFIDLRARLDDVFGIKRDGPAPRTAPTPRPVGGEQERCEDETVHTVER